MPSLFEVLLSTPLVGLIYRPGKVPGRLNLVLVAAWYGGTEEVIFSGSAVLRLTVCP